MRSLKRNLQRRIARLRSRRGIALFVTMFFVAAIGALALSAIYLTENASLLSKSYEREDDLKYASEAALAIGKAELNFNPSALPDTGFVQLMANKQVITADSNVIPGVTVDVYLGPDRLDDGAVRPLREHRGQGENRGRHRLRPPARAVAGELRQVRVLDEQRRCEHLVR